MNEGDIILVPLPQANGQIKPRPAVILKKLPPYNDLLVCGISTQLWQEVAGFDDKIQNSDPDFGSSGLREGSLIRLGFLAVFAPNQILGSIGEIASQRHRRLLERLAAHLLVGHPNS